MTTDTLIERLRALARAEHDDLSIGDEAADEIERLTAEIESFTDGRTRCKKCGDWVLDGWIHGCAERSGSSAA